MHFNGTTSLCGDSPMGVSGSMDGIYGAQGEYYGDFVPDWVSSSAFDADSLYRLDDATSMSVRVMRWREPRSARDTARSRSRGVPARRVQARRP